MRVVEDTETYTTRKMDLTKRDGRSEPVQDEWKFVSVHREGDSSEKTDRGRIGPPGCEGTR